ncbi:hypothetical protein L873DRAFT_1812510 [Choiromyces venosus 120613-1]|uniref:Uncharacterized protein n=1 Tax=Choiromyces venosus 120613-1 TaxID=1336337 RepID=A0A3N4JFI7_9PEZI|nr:hypothetical protein L873DRAFT_1812510 [Choiromyces venosus 120613-1]
MAPYFTKTSTVLFTPYNYDCPLTTNPRSKHTPPQPPCCKSEKQPDTPPQVGKCLKSQKQ